MLHEHIGAIHSWISSPAQHDRKVTSKEFTSVSQTSTLKNMIDENVFCTSVNADNVKLLVPL